MASDASQQLDGEVRGRDGELGAGLASLADPAKQAALLGADQAAAFAPFDRGAFYQRFTHHTATVGGANLHYVRGGEGPPILLLHGWPETWFGWNKVMSQLVDSFSVIAVDLPGQGLSDPPPSYDRKTVSSLLHDFMQSLNLGPVNLVGHDLGGSVAFPYAAQFPHSVRRLALLDTAVPGFGFEEAVQALHAHLWHFAFNAHPDIAEALVRGREGIFVRHLMQEYGGGYNPEALNEGLEYYIQAQIRPGVLRASFEYYRTLLMSDGADNRNIVSGRVIDVPALVAGSAMAAGMAEPLRPIFKSLQAMSIGNSGHFFQEERPILTGRILNAFFGD